MVLLVLRGGDTDLSQLPYLYGTAWKETATTDLVVKAVRTAPSMSYSLESRLASSVLRALLCSESQGRVSWHRHGMPAEALSQPGRTGKIMNYATASDAGLRRACFVAFFCPGEDLVGAALAKLAADSRIEDGPMMAKGCLCSCAPRASSDEGKTIKARLMTGNVGLTEWCPPVSQNQKAVHRQPERGSTSISASLELYLRGKMNVDPHPHAKSWLV